MKQFYRKAFFSSTGIFFFLFFLFPPDVSSQTYNNSWISYSQHYLKIKVVNDGVYRIDSTVLSGAMNSMGIPLSSVDPRNFQVFHNGQEQYIWVQGESDGVFNAGDYIEFLGYRNDGRPDSSLYASPDSLLDPYYSLYNDTSVYFLTWNNLFTNLRMTASNDTAFSAYTPADYFTHSEIMRGTGTYMPGVADALGITDPAFIPSEGYYTGVSYYAQPVTYNLSSANAYTGPGAPNAQLSMKVGTFSNDWNVANDNDVRIQYPGGPVFDSIYDGFAVGSYHFAVAAASLGAAAPVTVTSVNSNGSSSSGLIGTAFINLTYPHTFDMESRTGMYGTLPDNTTGPKTLVKFSNLSGAAPARVYDLYNHQRIDAVQNGIYYYALVQNGNGSEKPVLFSSEANVVNVASVQPENGSGLFTDFSQQAADSVFIIITHRSLMGVGTQYAAYRSSIAGGSHNVVLADVNELYDQFAWGIGEDPLAIRNFCAFMIGTFPTPPQDLLLLGKSYYADYARLYGYYGVNLVPTMGYPPCDNSLTAGLNGTLWEPAIPTGRIAAADSAQAQWYLNKVIEYENNQPAEWMKYVLHFGGGTSTSEQQAYKSYLQNYQHTIEDTLFGGYVQTYLKNSSAPIQINQSDSLRQRIEDGVSIMTFFGHASGTGFDQSIDDPSTYNNFDRYPFLIANSCYAGDIHSDGISSSEAFTLIDQKGTIGYLASVGVGIPQYLDMYTSRLYKSVGQVNYGQPVGKCIQWTVHNAETTQQQSIYLKTTCMEMTLQGDPAIVINSF
ncbi:MAG TPA: C25 family cysteine peptidase, partial [Bacteroidia bacterium]|nr:C25 family cysteine peptidase [Bacteroidia bacterium]